jgi:hypothetical protein
LDSSEIYHSRINPVVIAVICSIILCALNFFLNENPVSIIIYIISAGLYFLYSLYSAVDSSSHSDYIISGDGSFAILILIIGMRFFTENLYILFAAAVLIILLIPDFIKKNLSQNAGSYILNPLAILTTCYLFYFDKNFSSARLKIILSGPADKNIETAAIFFVISIIGIIFIYLYMPLGIKISHGISFNNKPLKFQPALHFIFLFLKSVILLSIIFMTGIAGFAAYYFYRFSFRGKIKLSNIFYFICIYLTVLFLLHFSDPLLVSTAVITLSIISHFIYKLIRVDIYDRSIRYKL